MRLAGWWVTVLFLAVTAVSCGFFDPLHPYDQEPVDTSVSWQTYMGGTGDEVGYSVQQTSDRGFIIVGDTSSFGAGGVDIWLVKTDVSGTVQWSKTFGGSEDDHGRCVVQTQDGGYIIARVDDLQRTDGCLSGQDRRERQRAVEQDLRRSLG